MLNSKTNLYMLNGKNIVICVCGGIAAHKVVEVASCLKKLNAVVKVIMTESAMKFVSPLTFQSISNNDVTHEMYDTNNDWEIKHITIAQEADFFIVAPATANIIGKVANGIADDLVSTTIMATKAPVVFIPAMNTAMYENPIVQNNIEVLKKYGYKFIEPAVGTMAMNSEIGGKGRLPEPKDIVDIILHMNI